MPSCPPCRLRHFHRVNWACPLYAGPFPQPDDLVYASFISGLDMLHLDPGGVRRLVEHASSDEVPLPVAPDLLVAVRHAVDGPLRVDDTGPTPDGIRHVVGDAILHGLSFPESGRDDVGGLTQCA